MTIKKVIILSAATCLAVNTAAWVLGWLTWPLVFIGGWLLLGCVARKISSYGSMKNDLMWKYFACNLLPPLVILLELGDVRVLTGLKQDYNIFNRLPKFQNPFVWPEKGGEMTIFAIIQAFLEAATEYLRLKNKTVYFDLLEKFDSRLDKLDNKRQILRSQPNTNSQTIAEEIVSEIMEEKKKLAEVKKLFAKP